MMIGQSGGPSTAINASLAGAVQRAMASDEIGKVYGMLNGLQGLLQRDIVCLSDQMTHSYDFELLMHTPAMALGSCRYKLPKDPNETYHDVLKIFREYDIGYFFYCGGNDSMDTIANLSAFFRSQGEDIKCVGIPKTIDNDLEATDHTPGFGSAARFVATSLSEIMIDSKVYPSPSITVVEIMGRNAGWLTASSVLARSENFSGPHLIYLPEIPFDPDDYLERVGKLLETETHVLIAVSEGIRWKSTGKYVSEKEGIVDMFGHTSLGGVANVLETLVKDKYNVKGRSVEPSVLQRVGMHLASGVDLREAQEVGITAVETALAGKTDVMVCIKRVSNSPYLVRYETAPLADVANHEKRVPLEWICGGGTNVTQEMVEYLRPLFRGATQVKYKDGLPQFFCIDRSKIVAPPAK